MVVDILRDFWAKGSWQCFALFQHLHIYKFYTFLHLSCRRGGRSKAAAAKDEEEEEDEEEEDQQEDEPTPKVPHESYLNSGVWTNLRTMKEFVNWGEFSSLCLFLLCRVARKQQGEEDELENVTEENENCSSTLTSWGSDVGNMDIELFKLFICRCSYCYTRIYHMHTTSVHPYHQLWVVALWWCSPH